MVSYKDLLFQNVTKKTVIVEKGWIAANAFQRMRGLLGYNGLRDDQGLFLSPGNCIHMRGMKFPLDVIFVNRKLEVMKVVSNLQPQPRWKLWKMTSGGWRSHSCFELPVGAIARSKTEVGDSIKIIRQ